MAIYYNTKKRIFCLETKNSTWSTSNKLMDSIPNILWQMLDMAHTTIIFSVNRTELKSI